MSWHIASISCPIKRESPITPPDTLQMDQQMFWELESSLHAPKWKNGTSPWQCCYQKSSMSIQLLFFFFLLLLMFLRVYFSEAQLCLVQIILCAHLLKVKGRKLMTTIKWSPSLSLAAAAGTAQLTLVWFWFPVNGGRWLPLSFCCAISAFVS